MASFQICLAPQSGCLRVRAIWSRLLDAKGIRVEGSGYRVLGSFGMQGYTAPVSLKVSQKTRKSPSLAGLGWGASASGSCCSGNLSPLKT